MGELIGSWGKRAGDACAGPYPAQLTILPGGHYRGSAAMSGEYTVWDVGTWAETEPGVLALSTANDAVIRYRYSLSGDRLQFEDPDGCTIAYAREPR